MSDFLISTSCKGRCIHPGGSISFRSTNNKVYVDGKPLVIRLSSNPISDNIKITGCNFKIGNAPHPCVSAKWKRYSKKILVNGHNMLMDQVSGECYAADKAFQSRALVWSIQRKVIGR